MKRNLVRLIPSVVLLTLSVACAGPEDALTEPTGTDPAAGLASSEAQLGYGSFSAFPATVVVDRYTHLGSTQICWSVSGHHSTAEVWLSIDGLPETFFTRAQSGCQIADWIQAGPQYVFNLYADTSHSHWLASVEVRGLPPEPVCGVCPRGSSCYRCGEAFCWPDNRPCP
ncbi:hypothetical protein [Pyxidicoccus xibeiensis]|uniref:hypothetical protein n=1 Tax=Pyxidicoccus xibeiensis TaxID=2906759 RepID=UPI0020A77B24|nr:hypothetical protein [Pyxidicoccus xibeiensis]MCP3136688.1 hypothetical protein [Pyxidicoccus xibeiensis]